MALIKNILSNKIGWGLVILSLLFLFTIRASEKNNEPILNSCVPDNIDPYSITWVNKRRPLWVNVVVAVHVPSFIVSYYSTEIISRTFFSSLCSNVVKIEMVILPICVMVQWLLVGYGLERLLFKKRELK